MNLARGRVDRVGSGTAVASAVYADVKSVITLSVINRGDAPVVAEMRDARGTTIRRFSFAPSRNKAERRARGVMFVDLRCQHGMRCEFDYEISAN